MNLVYSKTGDRWEEIAELFGRYRLRWKREPYGRAAPSVTGPIPGFGTIVVIDDGSPRSGWWEDELIDGGWVGMEEDRFVRACAALERLGAEGLRQLVL